MATQVMDAGIPAELHGDQPVETVPKLWEHLSRIARENGDSTAVISLQQEEDVGKVNGPNQVSAHLTWTYAELERQSQELAGHLFALGAQKTTPIVALVDNGAEWALLFWAAIRLDATFVPINPRCSRTAAEIIPMLDLVQPGVLVVLDDKIGQRLEHCASVQVSAIPIRIVVSHKEEATSSNWVSLRDVLARQAPPESLPLPMNSYDQAAMIIFTSGTTTVPKACSLTFANITAAALSYVCARHLQPHNKLAQHMASYHAFGIAYTLAFWLAEAAVVYPSMSFDAQSTLSAIQNYECTHMPAVPTMIHALLSQRGSWDLQSLKSVDVSGSVVPPELLKSWIESSKLEASHVSTCYGMSEGPGILATTGCETASEIEHPLRSISVGKPTLRAKIRICHPSSRTILNRGELGELHIGGQQVISGYHKAVDVDTFYQDEEGHWVVSGDQAMIGEDGSVRVMGRYKDLIIRGGENISPTAIEQCLNRTAGVESQVVGIPDDIAGELPVAVIKRVDVEASVMELQLRVANDLGQIYVPQEILDLERDLHLCEFPTTSSGKIRKSSLKAVVCEYLEAAPGKRPDAAGVAAGTTPLEQILKEHWAHLAGLEPDALSLTTSVKNFADSITIMRWCALVSKELGRTISMGDVTTFSSIQMQAQLLESSKERESSCISRNSEERRGPPGSEDVVHTKGSQDLAEQTRVKAVQTLKPFDFGWADVEDVFPASDINCFMLRALRPQSWNHRFGFITSQSNAAQVRSALESCLRRHPMFRTMAMDWDDAGLILYVVIRPSPHWFAAMLGDEGFVDTQDEFLKYQLNDSSRDFASMPGPLFKATIVHIRSTGTIGLIFRAHHSVYDASSMLLWLEDLDLTLQTNEPPKQRHINFKTFADMNFRYRESADCHQVCDTHALRLQGISEDKDCLWPPQVSPGWFKGDDYGWTHPDGSAGDPQQRQALDGEDASGLTGVASSICLPALDQLTTIHGIPTHIVMKAACVLFNIDRTGQDQAIFVQNEAARSWPVHSGMSDHDLPNPMNIAGPTYEIVIYRTHLNHEETVQSFLKRIQAEQGDLIHGIHAPFRQIQKALLDRGPQGLSDARVFDEILHRQEFNFISNLDYKPRGGRTSLQRVQQLSRSDIGFSWTCRQTDASSVHLGATYDDAQLRARDAQAAVEDLLGKAAWIADLRNWEKPVGSCILRTRVEA